MKLFGFTIVRTDRLNALEYKSAHFDEVVASAGDLRDSVQHFRKQVCIALSEFERCEKQNNTIQQLKDFINGQ